MATPGQVFNDLKKQSRRVQKEALTKHFKDRLARQARNIIYTRTKAGYGVSSERTSGARVTKKKLHKLSELYKKWRRGHAIFFMNKAGKLVSIVRDVRKTQSFDFKEGLKKETRGLDEWNRAKRYFRPTNKVTGAFGSAARSNLTLSGEMLDSMTSTSEKNDLVISIPNSIRKDGKTNAQVHDYVAVRGVKSGNGLIKRPFFNVTDSEVLIIADLLRKRVEATVRAIFS